MQPISGVPQERVGAVVQTYIDAGASTVTVVRDEDGTYTISAN